MGSKIWVTWVKGGLGEGYLGDEGQMGGGGDLGRRIRGIVKESLKES